ncbi:MAG: hypothetical protein M0Z87_00265 [Actinomycetota bacterium]|nr:hypothetical protein [Actinomycetota bacterium]
MRPTLRPVAVALGVLWLADGLLQLQPAMFHLGPNGLAATLADNAMVSPVPFYTAIESSFVQFVVLHITCANWFFAGAQIAIGAAISLGGLLEGRMTKGGRAALRLGLAASVPWAVGVWIFGEAFGQMIFPQSNMAVAGSPGAALLYGAVAALLLRPSAAGALVAWVVMWDGTGLLLLERGNWAPDGLAAQVAAHASGEPHLLASVDRAVSAALAGSGLPAALGMLIVQVLVGQAAWRPITRRASILLGAGVSLVYWFVGQNLGGVLSGHATDPSLGPAAMLLAWLLWRSTYEAERQRTAYAGDPPPATLTPHASSTRS